MEAVHRFRGSRMGCAQVCALGLQLMLVSSPGWGQVQGRVSSANSELLLSDEQTVTTVSKTVQKVSDAPAAVTVITEEQINAFGATNLLDILRYATGVDVIEPNGSVGNVSIRGSNMLNANRLLVMIDGRSIYQDLYGSVTWHLEPLLVSRIKRIEIVRGPGSALYGANAFNGVINIITKTPAELAAAAEKTTVRLLTGERNTQLLELQTTAGNVRDWSFSLGAAYNHTDGLGDKGKSGLYDSYNTPTVTFDAEKRLPQGTLRFAAGNAEGISDFIVTSTVPDLHSHLSYLSLTYAEDRAKAPLLIRAYANFAVEDTTSQRINDSRTVDVEAQQSRRLSSHHNLIYGASYRTVEAFSDLTGPHAHTLNQVGLYAQEEWNLAARTHLFSGVRFDNNSLYGSNFSPRLSLVHHLAAAQTLRASYSTAFRAPTIFDSYVDLTLPTSPQTNLHVIGNTNLKPEKVQTYEVGYRQELKQGYIGANVFLNEVQDQIGSLPTAFYPSPPFPPGTPSEISQANSGKTHIFGIELEAEKQITRKVRGLVNYAYQDSHANDTTSLNFVVPKHKINVGASMQFSRQWDASVGAHFVGAIDVLQAGASPVTVSSYTRVDTHIGYHFGTPSRPWSLSVIATNLFDDRHLEFPAGNPVESVPQRRTVYLALKGGF
jgi:outer membrane receptor for ferrienterochelin and colicin